MYARFFGLNQEPFSIAPDPRYLFMSKRHREALAHLLYGLGGGGGFVLLSGEIGAGKTTVCRCFLEQIPPTCNVAYIFNPKLTVEELLQAVCDEFGIARDAARADSATVATRVDALNAFLLAAHAAGRNNVLIIDEAQMLSADVLEQLRLLTNLETNERKLLQIILIGQPELRALLARPELEQLAQRVIARFHLSALSEPETAQYIRHRLAVAGLTHSLPFDRAALRQIHRLTRGVPRRINLLCDRALLGAYANGQARVDAEVVEKAAREVFGGSDEARSRQPMRRGPAAFALGLALLAGAALYGFAAQWLGGRADSGVAASHNAVAIASGVSAARAASGASLRAAMPAAASASATTSSEPVHSSRRTAAAPSVRDESGTLPNVAAAVDGMAPAAARLARPAPNPVRPTATVRHIRHRSPAGSAPALAADRPTDGNPQRPPASAAAR